MIEKKGKKKRILHSLKIREISGVDYPAMEGAKALLFKRADEDDEIEKRYEDPRLLSDEKGHSHILDLVEAPGGQTSFESVPGSEYGHAHPWVLNSKGKVVVGAAGGHSHNIIKKGELFEDDGYAKRAFSAEERRKLAEKGQALPDGSFPIVTTADLKNAIQAFGRAKNKGLAARHIKRRAKALGATEMLPDEGRLALKNFVREVTKEKELSTMPNTDENKTENVEKKDEKNEAFETLKTKVEDLEKKLSKAEAFGALTDPEKAHYAKLEGEDQEAFLKLDAEDKADAIEKAAGEDPIVYTSKRTGEKFHKSADPQLVALAKQADKDWQELCDLKAERRNEKLAKRADEVLKSYPGEKVAKVALVKAIDGIKDANIKMAVEEIVSAGEQALEKGFDRLGEGSGEDDFTTDAESKLEKMAQAKAEKDSISVEKAYAEILKTKEGEALYAESQREKKGK